MSTLVTPTTDARRRATAEHRIPRPRRRRQWRTAATALAFLAPWLFGYADESGAAWTSWIVGIIVVICALTAVPVSRQVANRQHRAA